MPFVRLAAALAVACATLPATAAPTAHARLDLGGATFRLEDTTPDDDASFGYVQPAPARWADACIGPGEAATCGAPGSPHVFQVGGDLPATMGRTLPDGTSGTATFSATGLRSDLVGTGVTGPKGGNASWSNELSFYGSGRLWVEADYRLDVGGLEGTSWRETLAWVGIILFPTGLPMVQVEAMAVAPAQGTEARDGRLRIAYDFRDGERLGVFLQAHTHRLGIAAPVPEPATWALVMAGVVVVGVARGRKRAG